MKYIVIFISLFLNGCDNKKTPDWNYQSNVPMNQEQVLLSWARLAYPKMACFNTTNIPQYKYLDGQYCIIFNGKTK
jgi:hypothetical protein